MAPGWTRTEAPNRLAEHPAEKEGANLEGGGRMIMASLGGIPLGRSHDAR